MTPQFSFWEDILRIPNNNLEEYEHSYVHSSVIYNSQHLETSQMTITRWVY